MRIGICCIAKDEDRYIEEWISYHQKLGVDEFLVYENGWRAPDSLRERFGIHLFPFDGDVMQVKAYNDCLTRTSVPFELDWLAFIDVDEFVAKRDTRSLKDILKGYDMFPAVALNWRLFGDSGLHADGKNYSVLERFTKCDRSLNRHVKAFLNLDLLRRGGFMPNVAMVNPHCANVVTANLEGNTFLGPFNEVNLEVPHRLELFHYFVKTPEEFAEKCRRGRADTTQKRKFEDDFGRHNFNEVEDTTAWDFYREGTR